MKQIALFILLLSLVAAGIGCSGSGANSANSGNANAESPFAYITDANVALAEGDRLMDENQTDMAIEAYRQAVKLNPDLAEGYFKLGIAYSLLERQIAQSGEVTDPVPNEGKTRSNSQRAFEKAVEAYKKWIEAHPNDDVAQYNLGRAYSKLLKDDEAEKAFRQAVKLKPDDTEYQTELGAVLIKLAKYREAIDPLKKAIELDSSNTRAQDLLEDAEAGRQRLDYVAPRSNSNMANANLANSNANMTANSNSNSAARPPTANAKPSPGETKKPGKPANRPN